jgi:hypothetical protein
MRIPLGDTPTSPLLAEEKGRLATEYPAPAARGYDVHPPTFSEEYTPLGTERLVQGEGGF